DGGRDVYPPGLRPAGTGVEVPRENRTVPVRRTGGHGAVRLRRPVAGRRDARGGVDALRPDAPHLPLAAGGVEVGRQVRPGPAGDPDRSEPESRLNSGIRPPDNGASRAQGAFFRGTSLRLACECLTKDRDEMAYYDFPAEHWKHLRTTVNTQP